MPELQASSDLWVDKIGGVSGLVPKGKSRRNGKYLKGPFFVGATKDPKFIRTQPWLVEGLFFLDWILDLGGRLLVCEAQRRMEGCR